MIKRGRKSQSEIVSQKANVLISNQRLPAPAHMTDAEMAVWQEVVNDQPASVFTPTHAPILEMYCRHVVNGRVLADEILNFDRSWLADDDGLKRYDRLLSMAERESRAAGAAARSLRITRQSLHPETASNQAKGSSRGKKPWELGETIEN